MEVVRAEEAEEVEVSVREGGEEAGAVVTGEEMGIMGGRA